MTATASDSGEDVLLHFLGPMTIVLDEYTSAITSYGTEFLLTPERRELTVDRRGNSWLDMLDDEEAQVRKFKQVMFRRGPWPEGVSRLQPGSTEWVEAREDARKAAHALQLPEERQRALAKVHADFGPAPKTSRTVREERLVDQ